jgi:hypothetical protein
MLSGIAVALAVCIVALIGLAVAEPRGTAFEVKVIMNAGRFIVGLGLGTTVAGAGLWMLARFAASYLTRRMAG